MNYTDESTEAAQQCGDAARTRIFEATCGDPDWMAVARRQLWVVH